MLTLDRRFLVATNFFSVMSCRNASTNLWATPKTRSASNELGMGLSGMPNLSSNPLLIASSCALVMFTLIKVETPTQWPGFYFRMGFAPMSSQSEMLLKGSIHSCLHQRKCKLTTFLAKVQSCKRCYLWQTLPTALLCSAVLSLPCLFLFGNWPRSGTPQAAYSKRNPTLSCHPLQCCPPFLTSWWRGGLFVCYLLQLRHFLL